MKYFLNTTKGTRIITSDSPFVARVKSHIPFTEEQLAFYEANPTASVEEIKKCEMKTVPALTLTQVKARKINEIDMYDCSTEVNEFLYNGQSMWLDKATRVGLVNSCIALEATNGENINIWYGNGYITLSVAQCRQLLAAIEVYAMECYNVTAQHKSNVAALETIEAVNGYDYTTNYPAKLNL